MYGPPIAYNFVKHHFDFSCQHATNVGKRLVTLKQFVDLDNAEAFKDR